MVRYLRHLRLPANDVLNCGHSVRILPKPSLMWSLREDIYLSTTVRRSHDVSHAEHTIAWT